MCSLDVLNKDQVQIEGVTFTSSLLRQQLTGRSRIFPYLITEGTELAEWSLSLDLLDQIFVYTLREAIVGQYRSLLEKKILEQYGISQISAMNPVRWRPGPFRNKPNSSSSWPQFPKVWG